MDRVGMSICCKSCATDEHDERRHAVSRVSRSVSGELVMQRCRLQSERRDDETNIAFDSTLFNIYVWRTFSFMGTERGPCFRGTGKKMSHAVENAFSHQGRFSREVGYEILSIFFF